MNLEHLVGSMGAAFLVVAGLTFVVPAFLFFAASVLWFIQTYSLVTCLFMAWVAFTLIIYHWTK